LILTYVSDVEPEKQSMGFDTYTKMKFDAPSKILNFASRVCGFYAALEWFSYCPPQAAHLFFVSLIYW
jgi:hypothetical protein